MPWVYKKPVKDSPTAPSATEDAAVPPQPDHAWKALSIVNEWVRYADTKTGVTLAFIGVTSTVLFNLVKDEQQWTCRLVVAVVACVAALLLSVVFAYLALFPRVESRSGNSEDPDEESVNLLFFGSVSKHYSKRQPTYREVLSTLTSDPKKLTRQISSQIHENSHIATVKFKYVNRAIMAELVAVGVVIVVAVIATAGW
ncbi:Pycsar system effector family protein [Paenarthrobacter sp. NPDC058040]|uniref:Pycsar system effector family protein n=1 Tax=unclassified Paenarthrobacter TaxID=2634190 RepID=UPI0036DB8833